MFKQGTTRCKLFLFDVKKRLVDPGLLAIQSTILNLKMLSIDWMEISAGQIGVAFPEKRYCQITARSTVLDILYQCLCVQSSSGHRLAETAG